MNRAELVEKYLQAMVQSTFLLQTGPDQELVLTALIEAAGLLKQRFEQELEELRQEAIEAMIEIVPIRLPICNVYLVKDRGAILVDTGRPRDAQTIVRTLTSAGIGPDDLTLILQTHGHWDHCGGTQEIKRWTRAPVAIHRADAHMLRSGDSGSLRAATIGGRVLKLFLTGRYPPCDADMILEGETDLNPFGIDGRIVTTPGHTAGSVSLLTTAGDAIIGDLLMGGFLGGRVLPRYPNLHYYAEDLGLLQDSVRRLLDLGPRRILPGHGGPLDPEWVRRRFLRKQGRVGNR